MHRRFMPLCVAALVWVFVAGCSASGDPAELSGPQPAAGQSSLWQAGLPALTELDKLVQPSRQTSADFIIDGADFNLSSPGAAAGAGTELFMDATATGPRGGTEFEWALYFFDPMGEELVQVTTDYVVLTGAAWVAVPNYDSGKWSWGGPYTDNVGISLDTSALSPGGFTYCAVAVPQGSNVTLNKITYQTMPAPAGPVTVDSDGETGWFLHMAIIAGRPAIAYTDFGTSEMADGDLTYVIADDAFGTTWGDPVVVDSDGDTGHDPSLVLVNGNPAIAYQKFDDEKLLYVRASDNTGSAWGSPLDVDSSVGAGNFPHMLLVNELPAILHYYWPFDGVAELRYTQATEVNGATWGAPFAVAELANPDDISDNWSMAIVGGNPAVSYADENMGPLSFRRASDVNGTAWDPAVPVANGGIQWNSLLAGVDGIPCISYYDSSIGELHFRRATDNTGSAWGAAVTVDDQDNSGFFNDMILFGGKPVIAYYSFGLGDLRLALADDAAGSAWTDKRTLDSVVDTGAMPTVLKLFDGSLMGIAYFDVVQQNLRFIGGIQ